MGPLLLTFFWLEVGLFFGGGVDAASAGRWSFSNDTEAVWVPQGLGARHVLLRPATLPLSGRAARMRVLVSAAPDTKNGGKVLALYRLYVNGVFIGIGPGRGEAPVTPQATAAVYDEIEVSTAVLELQPSSVSVALQCYHADGGSRAWAMLEAQVYNNAGASLGRFHTGAGWHGYSADSIFTAGTPDSGSAYLRVNEDLDAGAAQQVKGWQLPTYEIPRPAGSSPGWVRAEGRIVRTAPRPKSTLPLAVETGLRPASVVQLSASRYFFDFGRERMAGMTLAIPAATVEAWGGNGSQVEMRFSEQLAHFNKHGVLYPGCPLDCGNWNKIPEWVSVLTLAGGGHDNHFEHHEYIGLFRYGELRVKKWFPKDAGPDAFTVAQWSVAYPWPAPGAASLPALPASSTSALSPAVGGEASFVSSSPMLDAVWELCAATIRYTSLDTFTDSNVRERTPYEADGFVTSSSYWALRSERAWPRHSTQYILNNPTWPTEWKQYAVFLVHGHYMQTGDATLADVNFDQLVNQTMLPFVDPTSDLVNFTAARTANMGGTCPFGGDGPLGCNSPMCHADGDNYPAGVSDGNRSCDNIDWLPKFRAGYKFSATSAIVNAFAARALDMMAELANVTGRPAAVARRLAGQAARTRAAMLERMYDAASGMWCDGLCAGLNATGVPGTFHSQHYLLWLGATPPAGVPAALAYLKAHGMVGSTYSANSLLHGLYGRAAGLDYGQTALDLMTQCGDHSWCHMLQAGATATWEHWYPHDGTHSHPWAASPASAIAFGLFGVRPRTPGWATWTVKPAPGNLTRAAIIVPTTRGPIVANFTRAAQLQGGFSGRGRAGGVPAAATESMTSSSTLDLGVPPGTTATVCMPLFVSQGKAKDAEQVMGAPGAPAVATAAGFVLTLDGVPQSMARLSDGGAYLCLDGVGALAGRSVRSIMVGLSSAASPAGGGGGGSSLPLPLSVESWLPPLPRLNIDPEAVSISGLSSGADFAAQFAVAFSRTIMGVGVFAGQPWHCAVTRFANDTLFPVGAAATCGGFCEGCPPNETVQCDHCKNHPANVDVTALARRAEQLAADGLIDDVAHLARTRAYTYCGTNDQGHFGATVAARDFFAYFAGQDAPSNVLFNFTVPSGHCWPEDRGWNKCGEKNELLAAWPLQNCGYDGPGDMFEHFYSEARSGGAALNPPAEDIVDASLHFFDQGAFNGNASAPAGLGAAGLIYVPVSCSNTAAGIAGSEQHEMGDGNKPCALHVALHGCSNPFIMEYPEARSLSFNRWAETNRIVVLWPHINSHGKLANEKHGCWDGYGQSGKDYDQRTGVQMRAIQQMIEHISGLKMVA